MKLTISTFITILFTLQITAHATDFSRMQGHWLSEGYSWHLFIDEDSFTLHEVTAVSCLLRDESTVENFENLLGKIERLEKNKTFNVRLPYRNTTVEFRRKSKAPRSCREKSDSSASDPFYNFDVIWNTFNENYAFFELRDVDWKASRSHYRSQISDKTTPEELFDILAKMTGKLKDNHVSLRAAELNRATGPNPPPGLPIMLSFAIEYDGGASGLSLEDYVVGRFDEFGRVVSDSYLNEPVVELVNGKIKYSKLSDEIMYVSLSGMSGFIKDEDDKGKQLVVLERALDDLL